MADQKPEQFESDDESKKDTVRINLPPGLAGRPTGAPAPGGPATVKLKPATASSEDEAKKETAVMGRPAEAPKPKSDTSRVQVTAARPVQPETPRPTVKLKQPDAAPAAAPSAAPARAPVAVAAEPAGANAGMALASMVLSVAVAVYLAMLSLG